MAIRPGRSEADSVPPLIVRASVIGRIHTYLAFTAFLTALWVGCLCHYKKIVKNGVAGYPQEWFPSVSATIGDWYPERNIFQILIALTSGPRFALVGFQYYLQRSRTSHLPTMVFVSGIIRTLSCGGWVYITSSDDHDAHDVFMITYMVCNIPWMLGGIACTAKERVGVRSRRIFSATAFFVSLGPLIYFFIQHKVYRIPGAYTYYAFFEWGLILFDILYDSVSEQEFRETDLQVALGPSVVPGLEGGLRAKLDMISNEDNIEQIPINAAPVLDDAVPSTQTQAFIHVLHVSRPALSFLSDMYLSYISWSTFTALIPTLFYFSVWELGLAGHELSLFSNLSPILLGVPLVRKWVRTREGLMVCRVAEVAGLGAFVLKGPGERLAAVVIAVVLGSLGRAGVWADGEDSAGYQGILLGLGLLLASLSKHWNHANNPVWPFVNKESFIYNKVGIALGVLALHEFYTRPTRQGAKPTKTATLGKLSTSSHQHWLTAALPLGALIFTLHNHLADASTLISWSWTGYENRVPKGPVPHLHGAITLVVQCVGLLVPVVLTSFSSTNFTQQDNVTDMRMLAHPAWVAFGAASAWVMYAYKDWTGYAGGLGLAFWAMSITPMVFQRTRDLAQGKVVRTYTAALLVYCLFVLASLFTVAYAFVPGGVIFRERTDCVVFAQIACLALAFRWSTQNHPAKSTSLTLPNSTSASLSKTVLALISVLSVLGTLYRIPLGTPPTPYKPGPRIVNMGIWTVHFGIDNEGRESQRGITRVLSDLNLDVVGLLETDLHRTSFGHRDLTRVAAEEFGYYVDIGPGPNAHTWGAVLLSKFPIINSTHHLLPSPHGELAPAIEAILDVYGTEVTVVVSHNGQEPDALDRELQSKELARIMSASYPRPVVFLGYVVTTPKALRPAPYQILVEDGEMHDIDQDDEDRWCEYILYRGLYRTSYARVSRGIITDTELQIGQFVIPRHGTGVTDDSEPARYLRCPKEELPEDHWFPMAYYGDENTGGVNGHFYHVFNTPLYYKIPENAVL